MKTHKTYWENGAQFIDFEAAKICKNCYCLEETSNNKDRWVAHKFLDGTIYYFCCEKCHKKFFDEIKRK